MWGFGATIRRSGYRFIADGADRHKRWGPGTARFPAPLSHRCRKKPVWCVVRVLRAQDAQQAVLLVVDACGEPERVGAAGCRGTGQQAPQARLGERLAGGGVADLAGYLVRVRAPCLARTLIRLSPKLPARSEPAAGPVAGDEKVAAFRGLPANRYRRDLAGRPVAGRGLAAAGWLLPRRSS